MQVNSVESVLREVERRAQEALIPAVMSRLETSHFKWADGCKCSACYAKRFYVDKKLKHWRLKKLLEQDSFIEFRSADEIDFLDCEKASLRNDIEKWKEKLDHERAKVIKES